MSTSSYDPFDPTVVADPYPVYMWLRDERPVHHSAQTDTYVLSRYDDVLDALGDTSLYSSDAMRGVLLGQPTGVGEERLPREDAMGALVSVDPPAHSELRRIVNRGVTPKRITGWHDRMEELVSELMALVHPGNPFDVVGGLAGPLPVRVIVELVGADPGHADKFREWADATTKMMSGSARGGMDPEGMGAALELAMYLGECIEARQADPQDDLLSALVQAHGQEVLTRAEAVGFAALLLFAGTETSTNLIGNAAWALLHHRDQLDAVVDDPSRVDAVLEETLRWESPVQYVFRRATRAVEVHGVEIPQDATVTLVLGAANRDPRHWGDDADRFDIGRGTGGHVSFGFGPHFCLGAALARAEASAALRRLLPMLQDAKADGADDELIDSLQFRGRRHLVI
jgi:cytochrome P450